ncbi:hypothetical protein MHB65_22235 [Lysinibacillus sp. FSL K6-0075]|uniref:hypothetical protein n=1 Tax=Lysinibacillus sp. FSL K6-0075 TaxID=2921415 RepID=UPI0031584906
MTFKEAMIKEMTTRGMFESQAVTVINNYIKENKNPEMTHRWHDRISAYPHTLVMILWMGVKEYVAEWLSVNAPEAWFRPMFQYSNQRNCTI